MLRLSCSAGVLILTAALSCTAQCSGSGTSAPQGSTPSSAQSSATAQSAAEAQPSKKDSKKPKRVWTNDDVSGLNGSVSVVGNETSAKAAKNRRPAEEADSSAVASMRKELQKLRAQLEQADKQINDLKRFNEGDPSASSRGLRRFSRYNSIPIPDQIKQLEEKKKQIQARIDVIEDDARKRGIEPGRLR